MAEAATVTDINLLDPQLYVDPWDAYRRLRDEAPVYWDQTQKLWAISRYEDVKAVNKDGQTYSSFEGSRPHIDLTSDESMINLNDPAHQEQRGLVSPQFTPRSIRHHEAQVRAIVTEILDEVVPLGECEAIMICDLLGYPRELWPKVRHWSEQIMLLSGQTSPAGPPHVTHPDLIPLMTDFFTVTSDIVRARRAEPQDDLISLWAHTEGWKTKRVLDEAILILDGGAETTRTVIGTMIRELALRPDQRRLLLERPELLATTATEEFIRWVSPVLNMRRTASVDHELHGQRIAAGDQILLLFPSANRDERVYTDPDVLDVTRSEARQLAFGIGPHVCLGAHLARLEIRVMFEEMLRRMPDWELVDPDEPKILAATFAAPYDRIRIRWTRRDAVDS